MQITSSKNPLLQEIRRAVSSGRPLENGCIVLEGPHLVSEVARSGWKVQQVLASVSASCRRADLLASANAPVLEVADRAFDSIAGTESTQGLVALARPAHWRPEDLLGANSLIVVLDGLQDPGNAGTIVRSAEAFGASGVIFVKGCVRVANGKFLRATAGSAFRMPFLEDIEVFDTLSLLSELQVPVYALTAHGSTTLDSVDLRRPCALVVGNEGAGVSAAVLRDATSVRIPGKNVESLNAAVACSIALYEAQRQRRVE